MLDGSGTYGGAVAREHLAFGGDADCRCEPEPDEADGFLVAAAVRPGDARSRNGDVRLQQVPRSFRHERRAFA